jgi:hypothetical protein
MDKLLQEAIADAKAVRETALANAKLALEEAFTPHLKSMLSKKLQAEMENEEEEADAGEEAGDEADPFGGEEDDAVEEEMDSSDIGKADNKEPSAASSDDDGQGPEEEGSPSDQGDEDDEAEEAPDQAVGENTEAVSEEDEEEVAVDDEEEAEAAPEDVDLEEVLRELEAEMALGEEGEEEEEAPEAPAPEEPAIEPEEEPAEDELDLEAIIKALSEEDDEEEAEAPEAPAPEETIQAELAEYKQTVQYLKDKLSEVNLLNAKLLYTNKLFRSRNVSQEQKMKVIEQFDRAANVREVKLVYTTFAESMKRQSVNESARKKSQASKPVASTKGSKKAIIGENVDFKTRMKKLANII